MVEPIILAIVQGLTEFLPISSSAHLIVLPIWFDWEDQGLTFDVATHFGTLVAVLLYFRNQLGKLVVGCVKGLTTMDLNEDSRLAVHLVIATLPIVVVGFIFKDLVEAEFRSLLVIAVSTIVFGVALLVADIFGKRTKRQSDLTPWHALAIGIAQAIAIVPGTSRSGITITCALMFGFSRVTAAKFSFLLAIPTIAAATLMVGIDAVPNFDATDWIATLTGGMVSCVCAFLCIDAFLKFIERVGMLPFVIYRILIGVLLLVTYFAL